MKKSLLLMCVLLSPTCVWAGPIDGQQIPKNTKWVMHIDMQAFRDSALGAAVRDKWLNRDEMRKHLDRIREATGMDPSEDILGMTFFDSQFKKHHGVAMIHVQNADGQKLLARLNEKEPENRMIEFGPHKIYLWSKEHRHGRKGDHTICGTLYQERIMIFSRDLVKIIDVLDVLDGKKAGLDADSSLGAEPNAGTTLLMRGEGLGEAKHTLRCPVLKDSKWFAIEVGARDGKSFMNMVIDTNDEKVATSAKGVIEGFRALVNLRHKHEDLQDLLSALQVSTSGPKITVDWSAEESATMKAMKSLRAFHHKRHGKWKKLKNR